MILKTINTFFYFYYLLIILRIFLTWIPSIDWHQQPAKTLKDITDAYLDIFRSFIPPIGGLDFSPIVAILVLQLIQGVLNAILAVVF